MPRHYKHLTDKKGTLVFPRDLNERKVNKPYNSHGKQPAILSNSMLADTFYTYDDELNTRLGTTDLS